MLARRTVNLARRLQDEQLILQDASLARCKSGNLIPYNAIIVYGDLIPYNVIIVYGNLIPYKFHIMPYYGRSMAIAFHTNSIIWRFDIIPIP